MPLPLFSRNNVRRQRCDSTEPGRRRESAREAVEEVEGCGGTRNGVNQQSNLSCNAKKKKKKKKRAASRQVCGGGVVWGRCRRRRNALCCMTQACAAPRCSKCGEEMPSCLIEEARGACNARVRSRKAARQCE